MKKLDKNNKNNGYQITPEEWGYYIFIIDEKANECRSYEYSGGCGTLEEVEAELKKYTYKQIVKRYADQWVYCECVEQLY